MNVRLIRRPLWHKVLSVVMAVVLVLGLAPSVPLFGQQAWADPVYEGTVLVSLSEDGKFVVSDGEISDVAIAQIEVPLQEIAEIDLDSYDLGDYYYSDYDTGDMNRDVPTVLKLDVWLLDHYYGSAGDGTRMAVSGNPGSFFMNSFWGHDCNLLYYVNGSYPLAFSGWGATADAIQLADGDFVDIMMFEDWGFYSEPNAGFNYFAASDSDPADGAIVHEYQATAGEPLTVQVVRGMGDVNAGDDTSYVAADNLTVHYGPVIDVDDGSDLVLSEGKAQITFDDPGTYYVWVDGGVGNAGGNPCQSATSAKVTVTGGATPEPTTAKVDFTSQMSGGFLHAPQFGVDVASNLAESYGYTDAVDGVSALDVLVAAHEVTFGEDFTADTCQAYLQVSDNNVDVQFGVEPADVGPWDFEPSYKGCFFVNRAFPQDAQGAGTTIGTQKVSDGDLVEFFFDESAYMANTYTWFTDAEGAYSREFTVSAGEDLDLVLRGVWFPDPAQRLADADAMVNFESARDVDSAQLYTVNLETGALTEISDAVTSDGEVTISFANSGEYWIAAYADEMLDTAIMTLTKVTVTEGDTPVVDPGFTIKANGAEVPEADIAVTPNGYDAGYTDYQSGEWVESLIPLYTVSLPCGTEEAEITLNNYVAEYQSYIYDVAKGENGYVGMGFGEETTVDSMPTVIAKANAAYAAPILPEGQVYRIQTPYDPATWSSDNLYAIAFDVADHAWGEATYEWAEDNSTVTATRECAVCGDVETETVKALSEVTKEATETEEGELTWTSDPFENGAFSVQVKTEPIPKVEKLLVEHPGNPLWVAGQSADIVAQVANPLPGEVVTTWRWEYTKTPENPDSWKKTGAKVFVEGDVTASLHIPECTEARKPDMTWRAVVETSAGRTGTSEGQSLFVLGTLEVAAAGEFAWVEGQPVDIKAVVSGLAPGETVESAVWYYGRDNRTWKKSGADSYVSGDACAISIPSCTEARKAPMAWSVRVTTSSGRTATSEGISLVG